jgi:hypothetical protein
VTNIDLSRATYGVSWTNSNSGNSGNGIYDSNQWAVVFKYSSVNISNNATVNFLNNATHAPVIWLVSGDVTINGSINLDGQPGSVNPTDTAEPGPGGFRGGNYYGTGFGPGGGFAIFTYDIGFYSTTAHAYGNPQIVPLIGGSGGFGYSGSGGGGGGGAILIVAAGNITFNGGTCHANGGAAYRATGSGGGIRLVASQILGNGTIQATGDAPNAANGRIRLECTNTVSGLLSITPTPSAITLLPNSAPLIFPSTNATATIVSISHPGQMYAVPADPKAAIANTGNDDLRIVTTNVITIRVETQNFPTNGTVQVYIKPRDSAQTILSTNVPISGNFNDALWQLTTTAPLDYPAHTIIQSLAFY